MRAWRGDWKARARERIAAKGFSTATEFAAAFPHASLVELANKLGRDDVAAVHLEVVLEEEASTPEAFMEFVRSMLVRRIHQYLPNGWGADEYGQVRSYSSWSAALGDAYGPQAESVFDRLLALAPPAGWLPTGPDDPLILEAFRGIEFPPKYPRTLRN